MNMVMILLEIRSEAPSITMCLPPRLRRVPPTRASVTVAGGTWTGCLVFGVVGLGTRVLVVWVAGVLRASVTGVPLALVVVGVALLLPDPRGLGVMAALAMWAMAKVQTPDESETGRLCMLSSGEYSAMTTGTLLLAYTVLESWQGIVSTPIIQWPGNFGCFCCTIGRAYE